MVPKSLFLMGFGKTTLFLQFKAKWAGGGGGGGMNLEDLTRFAENHLETQETPQI